MSNPPPPAARLASAGTEGRPQPTAHLAQTDTYGRRALGELLLTAQLLTQSQLDDALRERTVVHGRRERVGETVVRLGFATEAEIGQELARQLGLEYLEQAQLLGAQEEALKLARRRRALIGGLVRVIRFDGRRDSDGVN